MTAVPPDFWATTAQVIPTLLLAYVLEERYTTPSRSAPRPVATLFVVAMIATGLTGEFLALRGLLGDGGSWSARFVVGATGALSCLIVAVFVWGCAPANLPGKQEIDRHPLLSGCLGSLAYAAAGLVTILPLVIAAWVAAGI